MTKPTFNAVPMLAPGGLMVHHWIPMRNVDKSPAGGIMMVAQYSFTGQHMAIQLTQINPDGTRITLPV